MLQTGANIHQVSSITVEHLLIMPSFWLVMSVETGKLKTLGEQVGGKTGSHMLTNLPIAELNSN